MNTDFSRPQKFKARITTKEQLTKTVYFIRYELISPDAVSFRAGQTFMLTVAPNTHRAMSIASAPQETHVLDSYQDVAPMGAGSRWLLKRNVGDEVELMVPLGRFVIDHDSPRKKVMVATGTGIAPMRSMLLDATDGRIPNETMSLYWGLRHEEDLYLQEELERIDRIRGNLVYRLTLSQPGTGWSGLRGHVQEHVFANETDPAGCDFYLCGNKAMIADMQQKLTEKGIPRDQMKFDPFY